MARTVRSHTTGSRSRRSALSSARAIRRYAPGAVIRGQGQAADRAVLLQRPSEGDRQAAVGRAEVAAVVDEAAIVHLLLDRGRARLSQPGGKGRTPAARIDHQVSGQLLASLGPHPGDVDGRGGRRPGQQPGDGDSASDGHARSFPGGGRHGPLHHGPPPRYHVEALIAVAPAPGERVRDAPNDVVLESAVRLEAGRHLWQLTCHHLVEAGEESMKEAELVHPPPIPVLPGGLRIRRGRLSVALDTRHPVPRRSPAAWPTPSRPSHRLPPSRSPLDHAPLSVPAG